MMIHLSERNNNAHLSCLVNQKLYHVVEAGGARVVFSTFSLLLFLDKLFSASSITRPVSWQQLDNSMWHSCRDHHTVVDIVVCPLSVQAHVYSWGVGIWHGTVQMHYLRRSKVLLIEHESFVVDAYDERMAPHYAAHWRCNNTTGTVAAQPFHDQQCKDLLSLLAGKRLFLHCSIAVAAFTSIPVFPSCLR